MKFFIIVGMALLVGCGSKKGSTPVTEKPNVDQPQNPQKPPVTVHKPTEDWFAEQETVYHGFVENDEEKIEEVVIDRETRKIEFTFYRDVSKIDPEITDSAFCKYQISGEVLRVREARTVKFHTEHVIHYLDMRAETIEKVDSSNGSDRRHCAVFEKNMSDQMPFEMKDVPFSYFFNTPSETFTLRRGDGQITDPMLSFIELTTSRGANLADWDIEYEVNDVGGKDFFNSIPITDGDDYAELFDLGDDSCKKIGGQSKNRYLNPVYWLMKQIYYNPGVIGQGRQRQEVKIGHCYLLSSVDSNTQLYAMFRVANHEQGRRVVLHEIEVLNIVGP